MIVMLDAALLAGRWRRASLPARRELDVLLWVVLAGGALGLLTALASAVSAPLAVLVFLSGGFAVVVALLPFAFLAGLLRVRLARGRVADLVVDLEANPDPARLRDALARTLGDHDLELAYRLPGGGWVDIAGRPTTPGSRRGGAHLVHVERRGTEPLFAETFAESLRGHGIDVVGRAGTLPDVVRLVDRTSPDAAILDIAMPPDFTDEGIRAAEHIRAAHPQVGLLVCPHTARLRTQNGC